VTPTTWPELAISIQELESQEDGAVHSKASDMSTGEVGVMMCAVRRLRKCCIAVINIWMRSLLTHVGRVPRGA